MKWSHTEAGNRIFSECISPPLSPLADLMAMAFLTDYTQIKALHFLSKSKEERARHLVDVDAVAPHVVTVVDLPSLGKLHGEDPLGGEIPVDLRDLSAHTSKQDAVGLGGRHAIRKKSASMVRRRRRRKRRVRRRRKRKTRGRGRRRNITM